MKAEKQQAGIWLDHTVAHFVHRAPDGHYQSKTIKSEYKNPPIEDPFSVQSVTGDLHRSANEYGTHTKAIGKLHDYFRQLKEMLNAYNDILLAGPGTAKREFFNFLREDKQFEVKQISLENADRMDEEQVKRFVKNFFEMEETV